MFCYIVLLERTPSMSSHSYCTVVFFLHPFPCVSPARPLPPLFLRACFARLVLCRNSCLRSVLPVPTQHQNRAKLFMPLKKKKVADTKEELADTQQELRKTQVCDVGTEDELQPNTGVPQMCSMGWRKQVVWGA